MAVYKQGRAGACLRKALPECDKNGVGWMNRAQGSGGGTCK